MNSSTSMQPANLYKYRNDSEFTEKIFETQKIWLSTPSKLNDPLECRIGEIPRDWESKTIRQMEEGQLLGVIRFPFEPPKTLFYLSERKTKRWFEKLRKLPHKQKISAMRNLYSQHGMDLSNPENTFKDMRKRLASVGIFSLSENYNSELMWAHYASQHAGIVIGFNRTPSCKLGNSRHTFPVAYTAEKPTFSAGFTNEVQMHTSENGAKNIGRVSFEDKVFRSTISTKTPAWQYEQEWRYVEEAHGSFDLPGTITTIMFGLRMKPDRRNVYKRLAYKFIKNDINFFEVRESKSLSGLEIKKI